MNSADDPPFVSLSRIALHELMAAALERHGVPVRLGTTVEALEEYADGVRVTLTDGTVDDYDLVVGADGVNSEVRDLILPAASVAAARGTVHLAHGRAVPGRPRSLHDHDRRPAPHRTRAVARG